MVFGALKKQVSKATKPVSKVTSTVRKAATPKNVVKTVTSAPKKIQAVAAKAPAIQNVIVKKATDHATNQTRTIMGAAKKVTEPLTNPILGAAKSLNPVSGIKNMLPSKETLIMVGAGGLAGLYMFNRLGGR